MNDLNLAAFAADLINTHTATSDHPSYPQIAPAVAAQPTVIELINWLEWNTPGRRFDVTLGTAARFVVYAFETEGAA